MNLFGDRFSIRPIVAEDFPALLEVYRQCGDFLALGPQPHASAEMIRADLALSSAAGGLFCGIFDPAGAMLGVVDFVPAGHEGHPAHGFIELLMIAQPHRGRGLGAGVIRAVEAEISRAPQVTAILAGVQVNNPAAIRFWDRMGYKIVGGPELFLDGTTAWSLRKELGSAAWRGRGIGQSDEATV
ncbi:MAG: N-acetyltransferase [Chloroflexi bacterium]|nr:N-acetyltransferase [Chloroflexota bacterium]